MMTFLSDISDAKMPWNFEMMTFLSDISETFSTLQGPKIDLKPLLTDNLKQCLRFPLFHHKHAQSA